MQYTLGEFPYDPHPFVDKRTLDPKTFLARNTGKVYALILVDGPGGWPCVKLRKRKGGIQQSVAKDRVFNPSKLEGPEGIIGLVDALGEDLGRGANYNRSQEANLEQLQVYFTRLIGNRPGVAIAAYGGIHPSSSGGDSPSLTTVGLTQIFERMLHGLPVVNDEDVTPGFGLSSDARLANRDCAALPLDHRDVAEWERDIDFGDLYALGLRSIRDRSVGKRIRIHPLGRQPGESAQANEHSQHVSVEVSQGGVTQILRRFARCKSTADASPEVGSQYDTCKADSREQIVHAITAEIVGIRHPLFDTIREKVSGQMPNMSGLRKSGFDLDVENMVHGVVPYVDPIDECERRINFTIFPGN